jgi:dTDP-4-dehydrorhamnose 3,5-epimerase
MTFTFTQLDIPDVFLITPQIFSDDRGFFSEYFRESLFVTKIKTRFIQDNFSYSIKNVLRGLHYQRGPKTQAKLVATLSGTIFDVAVDIRRGSPTYGRWVGVTLSEENHKILYIPEGFAHGFCVTSNEAKVLYKVNREYSPQHEAGIIWNDPKLNIKWPTDKPIVSQKDAALPTLENSDNDFSYTASH